MIKHGCKPTHADERDYSTKSFGSISLLSLPLEFSVDRAKPMPDQNADGLPMGCTGYTQSDNAGNEDDSTYNPAFTYLKTCEMEGHSPNQGCDVRNSLESERIYGLMHISDNTPDSALDHRRGAYFQLWDDRGMDYFDNIRATIVQTKRGVSIGSPWYSNWTSKAQQGDSIMPLGEGNPYQMTWHNYSIVGWKVIKGVQYLVAKPWQGTKFGDNGYVYFPRQTINKVLAISGTCAFTIAKYKPEDVVSIKLSLFRYCLVYISRYLGFKVYN